MCRCANVTKGVWGGAPKLLRGYGEVRHSYCGEWGRCVIVTKGVWGRCAIDTKRVWGRCAIVTKGSGGGAP